MERNRTLALIALFVLPLSWLTVACDSNSRSSDDDDDDADDDDDDNNDDDNNDNNDDAADDDDDDNDDSCAEEEYEECLEGQEYVYDNCAYNCAYLIHELCSYIACTSECSILYRWLQIECAVQYNCPDGVRYFECVVDCHQALIDCLKPLLTCDIGRAIVCSTRALGCYYKNCAPL